MARIIQAQSRLRHHTVTGAGTTFSVPSTEDFTSGTWSITDLCLSEIGVNEADNTAYIRIGNNINEISLVGSTGSTGSSNNLEQTLAIGNDSGTYDIIMGTSTVIKTSLGGGQLNLDYSGANNVLLSTDNAATGESYLYLGPTLAVMTSTQSNIIGRDEVNISSDNIIRLRNTTTITPDIVTIDNLSVNVNRPILMTNSGYIASEDNLGGQIQVDISSTASVVLSTDNGALSTSFIAIQPKVAQIRGIDFGTLQSAGWTNVISTGATVSIETNSRTQMLCGGINILNLTNNLIKTGATISLTSSGPINSQNGFGGQIEIDRFATGSVILSTDNGALSTSYLNIKKGDATISVNGTVNYSLNDLGGINEISTLNNSYKTELLGINIPNGTYSTLTTNGVQKVQKTAITPASVPLNVFTFSLPASGMINLEAKVTAIRHDGASGYSLNYFGAFRTSNQIGTITKIEKTDVPALSATFSLVGNSLVLVVTGDTVPYYWNSEITTLTTTL